MKFASRMRAINGSDGQWALILPECISSKQCGVVVGTSEFVNSFVRSSAKICAIWTLLLCNEVSTPLPSKQMEPRSVWR